MKRTYRCRVMVDVDVELEGPDPQTVDAILEAGRTAQAAALDNVARAVDLVNGIELQHAHGSGTVDVRHVAAWSWVPLA